MKQQLGMYGFKALTCVVNTNIIDHVARLNAIVSKIIIHEFGVLTQMKNMTCNYFFMYFANINMMKQRIKQRIIR